MIRHSMIHIHSYLKSVMAKAEEILSWEESFWEAIRLNKGKKDGRNRIAFFLICHVMSVQSFVSCVTRI